MIPLIENQSKLSKSFLKICNVITTPNRSGAKRSRLKNVINLPPCDSVVTNRNILSYAYKNNYKSKNNKSSVKLYQPKKMLRNFKNSNNLNPPLQNYQKCWKFLNILILGILSFIILADTVCGLETDSSLSSNNDNFFNHPRNEFSTHTIIKPKVHHGRHKRAITSTLEENGLHAQHIVLSYHHQGQKVIMDLQLNEQLIPQGHFLRYQHSKISGEKIVQNFTKTELDLCHYQGSIRGNPNSRVAVSTCNGINGVVFDGSNTYFIYSGNDGEIHNEHYLFRHDNINHNATCGYSSKNNTSPSIRDGSSSNNNEIHDYRKNISFNIPDTMEDKFSSIDFIKENFNRILRYKRSSTDDNTIRGPYNANKHSSFVELVIVVDNKVYKTFGENLKKVHNHCKDIANIVNALFVPLNIFIALVGVVVWTENNEIELSSDGDITLKNFLHYRRKILAQEHPNDNAQLLTKEQFSGGVVGKALKGPMCTYEYSGGVSMEHSQVVGVVATTVAHEMGHNFGMEHDTSDCKCKDEKCIMSASSTSVVPRYWSSCSIDQLNVAFSRGMNYCLRNKPVKLFDSPQCGNGFVEPGEQCDCGLPQYCENTCCNPKTCMLYPNATCATGECCDLKTCRPKSAGTGCRSAEGECDLPEYCTGESEYCPQDVYRRDTESCDEGNAFCYQGSCRSRSNQCKILWGPSGDSSEHCYKKNVDGSRHGNCGYDRIAQKYTSCMQEDVYCGMLHCRHLNERLEFGMESAAVLSHSFMNYEGNIVPCRTAIVDLGLQSIDPGLTPNGAKCGNGKMCVNQKCVAIEKLRSDGMGSECPNDCNGHGICNSKGRCHCFIGFGPPDCSAPGSGGSEDSGPATNPNGRIGFTRAMYIFFLGVVPTVSLFLFFTYYWKQNRPLKSSARKSATVLKTTTKSIASRGSSSPPGNGAIPTSSPSSTDDMNSALLRSPTESDTSLLNNSMFGKFKGFTLRPLPNSSTGTNHVGAPNVAYVHPVAKSPEDNYGIGFVMPARSAPPPPKPTLNNSTITTAITTTNLKSDKSPRAIKQNGTLPNLLNKSSSTLQPSPPPSYDSVVAQSNIAANAPALPPPNPGSNARPIISSPILETSTCTAKELISPLKGSNTATSTNISNNINNNLSSVPIRSAPIAPPVPPHADPNFYNKSSSSSNNSEKNFKEGTIKRIASFLKKEDSSIQKYPPKSKPIIDREKLKNIEISAPIPVIDSTMGDNTENSAEEHRQMVVRTQSMRDTSSATKKPSIHSFGSMRHPSGVNRPKSMVNSRPKSPPPRPPAPQNLKIAADNKTYQNEYDDCEAIEVPLSNISEENSPTISDNIYSVIDERPEPPVPDISGSTDSMGLLGEIVNEIEKRNIDSIYSVSTLKKKKSPDNSEMYPNSPDSNDYSEEDYSKSTASTTSSGYLRPTTINTPVARVAPTRPDLPPTLPATTNNDSSQLSTFRPKVPVHQSIKADSSSSSNNKVDNKAILSNRSAINRIASNSITKPSTDLIRKRSPSPVRINSQKSTNGLRKNPIVLETIKNGDTKKITNSTNNISTQKPKPLVKPSTLSSKPSFVALESKLVSRQNPSASSAAPSQANTGFNKRSKSSSTDQQSAAINRKPSLTTTTPTTVKPDNLTKRSNSSLGNNSTSSDSTASTNKILNSMARPTPGKISNVASLQQKFENVATTSSTTATPANKMNSISNFSSVNNSLTAKK